MRTHPHVGLVIADLLQLARFWLCTLNERKDIILSYIAFIEDRSGVRHFSNIP